MPPLLRLLVPGILVAAMIVSGAAVDHVDPTTSVRPTGDELVRVVVRHDGQVKRPQRLSRLVDGHVHRTLATMSSFVADVPARELDALERLDGVVAVTPDAAIELSSAADGAAATGSMTTVTASTGATAFWAAGHTGAGVDVAIIDTGVEAVGGLDSPGKLTHGPDLSFEGSDPELAGRDGYGHGTHMAGIVAGRDGQAPPTGPEQGRFLGMAPDAGIVSVRVGDGSGRADVSQVIAAIDWIVQHRDAQGRDIRVLNLSFGTDSTQHWLRDPLSHAADVAWRAGIVVVAAAGNEGFGSAELNDPARNPRILAVGAADDRGTPDTGDDEVADFSSSGAGGRRPDLVAPGLSVASLRAPGSYVDEVHPESREGDRLTRGTGTSQAAAVVAGAAALVLSQRPDATPDEVKELLRSTADPLPDAGDPGQGAGMIDLDELLDTPTPTTAPQLDASTGTGSLDKSRGSLSLTDLVEVPGEGRARGRRIRAAEVDVWGRAFDSRRWARAAETGSTWDEGFWLGPPGDQHPRWPVLAPDDGDLWPGNRWSGNRWSGNRWSGNRWSGNRWSGNRWSGNRWSSQAWSAAEWS